MVLQGKPTPALFRGNGLYVPFGNMLLHCTLSAWPLAFDAKQWVISSRTKTHCSVQPGENVLTPFTATPG